jgi:dinuclear metal center YbgI/SA1388 family protein
MNRAKLSDIVGIINKIAPPSLAEDWDNVGLQVGDTSAEIKRIMIALDPGAPAIEAAINDSCQLLLTHHPFIFKPLKKITSGDETGRLIQRAIKSGLAVLSLHTNYDTAANGVNDLLGQALGLQNLLPLKIVKREELLKLVVYIPASHENQVKEELLKFSALQGHYDECSFTAAGTGTFRPLAGATPFIGTNDNRESVAECRFEILLTKSGLPAALKALYKTHPYEEPAFDIVPLLNEGTAAGIGRIGVLAAPMTGRDFAAIVKQSLAATALRAVGDLDQQATRVALCGGSGISLLHEAVRAGADIFVTGDIKYHEAREAEALGITLIDAGHFATEHLMVAGLSQQLEAELARRKFDAEVMQCTVETDPFVTL